MAPEVQVRTKPAPLSGEQEKWIERAWSAIDEARLAQVNQQMASIPSPTGEEGELARHLVSSMRGSGMAALYQPIDDLQGNAVGRIPGSGEGPDLLLYAPLDTAFTGLEAEDCPWIGAQVPPEMTTASYIQQGGVVGLGAENPKSFASCIVMAAEAVKRAEVPLRGSLIVGFGAGGMPTNKRPHLQRFNSGQGTGCAFMLEQGARGDFAIITKPGYSVAWEEVGLCWFRLRIGGDLGYTGVRHLIPGTNPIVAAAKVISLLEEWFPRYTERNTSGLVTPQGSINAVEAGWPYKPAFVPAACYLYVDLRISPRTDPMQAKQELGQALAEIRRAVPGLELDSAMILAIPGTTTDPENWIVQSCMRAWEYVERKPHTPNTRTSGATDANILRSWGIPTARLGIPFLNKDAGATNHRRFSMSVSDLPGMRQLTKCLVYAIIDTCTRERGQVGLGNG